MLTEVKPSPAPDPGGPIDDERLWPTVLAAAACSPKDQAKVQNLEFDSFDGRTLRLAVAENAEQVARFLQTQTEAIAELVQRATGRRVRIELDTTRAEAAPPATVDERVLDEVQRMPAIQKALELFDAVVVSVEARTSPTEDGRD